MDKQKKISDKSRKVHERYEDWEPFVNGPAQRVEIINTKTGEKKLLFEVTECFLILWKIWGQFEGIVSQGGTNSSKTYSKMQLLCIKAIEKKRKIRVIGQDLPNLKEGPIADLDAIRKSSPVLNEWIVDHHGGDHLYTFYNGSTIRVKSVSDAQDAKQGKSAITFFNEVNGMKEEEYDELADRTDEKVLMDFNPTAKFWVHDKLLGEPGFVRIITNYTHNRFCPPKIINKLLRYQETNPHRWKVYGLGLTGVTQGTIFPVVNWIAPDEFPPVENLRRYGFGSDYGYTNDPITLVEAGLYQGKIYARALLYNTGLKTREFASILEYLDIKPWDVIAFDDSQAKEQADLLRDEYGFNIVAANRRGGSIEAGIKLLKEYPLYIVKDENWQREQENYKWIETKSKFTDQKKPVDKFNHLWDALRYWALEMLGEPEQEDYKEETVLI